MIASCHQRHPEAARCFACCMRFLARRLLEPAFAGTGLRRNSGDAIFARGVFSGMVRTASLLIALLKAAVHSALCPGWLQSSHQRFGTEKPSRRVFHNRQA